MNSLTALISCSSFCIIFLLSQQIFRESKASFMHFFAVFKSVYENKPLIDVSVLSVNPKFACTGERVIQKTPRIWAGGNSTGLFINLLPASPLAFTASQPKQKHSRAKSRQLRRLDINDMKICLPNETKSFLFHFFHKC